MKNKGTLTRTLVVSFLGAFLLASVLGGIQTTKAQTADANSTSAVNVTIAEKTMVDMQPEEMIWTGVEPGTSGNTNGDFSADTNPNMVRGRLQIENIGSTNFSDVWFHSTMPDQRPFGTGASSQYDAANFIAIGPEDQTGGNDYQFVNRKEFNETRQIVYLTDPGGTTPPDTSNWVYGRFRNTSQEYFWMLSNVDTINSCSDLTMHVGNNPRTDQLTGTVDFTGSNVQTITVDTNVTWDGSNYCVGSFDLGGQADANYTAAVHQSSLTDSATAPEVLLTKWNADLGAEYFNTNTLHPGDSIVAEVDAYVPFGVAQGDTQIGTLTVLVSRT